MVCCVCVERVVHAVCVCGVHAVCVCGVHAMFVCVHAVFVCMWG